MTVPNYVDYTVFTLGDIQGVEVTGMQALADDSQAPSWTSYFYVDNLRTSAEGISSRGGMEMAPPSNYGLAEMTLCSDPQGAEFGISVPRKAQQGFQLVRRPGAIGWIELATRDLQGSSSFYGEVFGWRAEGSDESGRLYAGVESEDPSEAVTVSMAEMDATWPPDVMPQWIPYFWTDDCDVAAARVVGLGGDVVSPPRDDTRARSAMVADPTGARLGIFTPRQ
jgi:predicted enzyme related to lactoylglutathione lyase